MKKPIILSLIAVCLIFTFMESALSQETLTHGCYNWRRGTLRIVTNPYQCNPSFEIYIPWHKAIPSGGFPLDLYVNKVSGQDLPGRGLTAADPFQTITYALQQLMHLRPTQEIETIINVAPETYNENLNITGDNIRIIKDESYPGDVIIDGVDQDVITVDGAQSVAIEGFTIQNGNRGIIGRRGSAFGLKNITVQDCDSQGIAVDENSTLRIIDCTVQRSGEDGIGVYRSSNATFFGSVVSNDNDHEGLRLGTTSNVLFDQATFTANNNGWQGITVAFTSNLYCHNSRLTTNNNVSMGIYILGSSSVVFLENSSLTSQNNSSHGVVIINGSNMSFSDSSTLLSENNSNTGLVVNNTSSAALSGTTTISTNGFRGIGVYQSSNLHLGGTAIVQANGEIGIAAIEVANVEIRGGRAEILNNASCGLIVMGGSTARFDGVAIIAGNQGGGIFARGNSAVLATPFLFDLDLTVSNNDRFGVLITNNSSGTFDYDSVITNNHGDGFQVNGNSFININRVTVTNNDYDGIDLDNSSANISNSTITGHGASGGPCLPCADVNASFGSRLTLKSNSISKLPITCEETVLSRADPTAHLCP